MKKSIRTIYGALIDTCNRFNSDLPILENSTLNEKFGVAVGEKPRIGERGVCQYFAIGLKGTDINLGTDGLYETKYREYSPQSAALYGHCPFVIRPLDNDLTPSERQNYRMRCIVPIAGIQYVCYYLKKADLQYANEVLVQRKLVNGQVSQSAWAPELAHLNPVPLLTQPGQVLITGDDYVAASKVLKLEFTPADIQNIMEACNIIYGSPNKANITEIGLVSGIERQVVFGQGNQSGQYTEAIYAQLTDILHSTVSCPNAYMGQTLYVDAGSNEPTLLVS